MKSIYLDDINEKSQEISLMVKDKINYNGVTRYILGDITKDIYFYSNENIGIQLESGDVVSVKLKNNKIEKINKRIYEYELRDYLCHTKMDISKVLSDLNELTTLKFKNRQVIELDNYFFKNEKFLKKFSLAIGGLEHHVYIGGLAEHTLSVTYWCEKMTRVYECTHSEIAILAAKLHDIGKIYEYTYKGRFRSTLRGEMEGHVVIGIEMIEEAFKANSEIYDDNFKNRIKGCVVQHHGRPEYGSPKAPNTQEAFIVHYADYLDATMNKVVSIKEDTLENCWSKYDNRINTKIYI